ncbi:MAG: hypothetical protein QXO22_08050 [Thermosphaera sp.]
MKIVVYRGCRIAYVVEVSPDVDPVEILRELEEVADKIKIIMP